MDEDPEKSQFLISSDTFSDAAGALAQTEGVELNSSKCSDFKSKNPKFNPKFWKCSGLHFVN